MVIILYFLNFYFIPQNKARSVNFIIIIIRPEADFDNINSETSKKGIDMTRFSKVVQQMKEKDGFSASEEYYDDIF